MFELSECFHLSLRFSCFGLMDGLGYQVQACLTAGTKGATPVLWGVRW